VDAKLAPRIRRSAWTSGHTGPHNFHTNFFKSVLGTPRSATVKSSRGGFRNQQFFTEGVGREQNVNIFKLALGALHSISPRSARQILAGRPSKKSDLHQRHADVTKWAPTSPGEKRRRSLRRTSVPIIWIADVGLFNGDPGQRHLDRARDNAG